MTRLPTPGGDEGNWGVILNDYLSASHKPDGTLKQGIITTSNLDPTLQAQVTAVAGQQGATGPSGPQGLVGATGASGTNGSQGSTGATGAASTIPGPTGPQGATGLSGPAGSTTITGISGLQEELDGKAATSHIHSAVEITSGTFVLDRAIPGTTFDTVYDGTDWRYAGSIVTARPTARTDLVMQCVNPVDATIPAWAITGDRLLRIEP